MPGRQAHGRPLIAQAKSNPANKSKARSRKHALDAIGIAEERFPTKEKRTPRARELDAEIDRKRDREESGDDEGDEDEAPRAKKPKASNRATENDGAEYGSDSEGNEWQLGGMAKDDEDSEIESDDAFGESDEEKFEGYTFRGSKSRQAKDADSEDDENDDEGETLGEDAVDLATALDQYESSEDEPAQSPRGSEESGEDDDESGDSGLSEDSESEDDDYGNDAESDKLEALQGLISGFGGEEDESETSKSTSKPRIELSDLGLSSLSDPFMSRSVKLMKKEAKEDKPGSSKKLDVPLARREQGRLDRSAAYEKTNQTLDRWTDTVKQNRRAEHLVFPLPQNSATAGLDTTELQPLTVKNSSNELESTIMSIMEQSGLSMERTGKPKQEEFDEDGNILSRKDIQNRKRMERELNSREAKRTRRIKKIKSKAYHRVHRKQRERDEMATREAMEEAGEIDSEDEREAQDRRRALERVGQRHKESKWAKLGSKTKRAVWDDDFRTGLTEMARKDEELRRRKEGKAAESDDESVSSGSDDDNAALRRQLDRVDEEDDEPRSKLMNMKFMQNAEAAQKQANDEMVKQIRKELDGDAAEISEEEEKEEIGRRQYGMPGGKGADSNRPKSTSKVMEASRSAEPAKSSLSRGLVNGASTAVISAPVGTTESSTAGAWSRGEAWRKKKGSANARVEDLDLNANIMVASLPNPKKTRKAASANAEADAGSESETDLHLPLAIRDHEMVARAFAGEDVLGEFEREKQQIAEEDDDKVVDNTLPGWGNWVGDGISKREQMRNQGRFMTKVDGVKKKQDRQDAKLDKVIINERRVKKNDRYLASQLPHPFESRPQYERALRLPVGPEWMTKETFQDSTKPRVLMKQGVIAPISKPTI